MPNKVKALRMQGSRGLLVAVQLLLSVEAYSQDDLANRRAAAERYEATMPIAKMLDESIQQMALSLPNHQRDTLFAQIRQAVDDEQLRAIALDKMAAVFTVEELDALTAFYGSTVGQSIVTKFPVYMAEMLPVIELEVARAARSLKDRSG
ncbi:MAG: DUF2059 domain-containing protein [Geminicoccaceae bacterium]